MGRGGLRRLSTDGGGGDDDSLESGASSDSLLREIASIDDSAGDARLPGSRIGRFVVEGVLGRGGMGTVYRALDVALGRTVALKVLPTGDADRRARFLREARAAAGLVHPNVVTVYEVGEAEGSLFIAMALVAGGSLRARLSAGPRLTVDEAVAIGRDVARGLVAAHAAGLVHRDLKPENIMLGAAGEAIILDFGLAKLGELHTPPRALLEHQPTDSPSTEEGRLLGTPAYMSPEQAAGKAVDARSDLFSFGVVMYEMLAGERPFGGSSSIETLAAVLRDIPAPLSQHSRDLPPVLVDLVMRCLSKRKEDRPASAAEVLSSLERRVPRGEPQAPARRLARPWPPVVVAILVTSGILFGLSQRHVASAPLATVDGAAAAASAPSVAPTSMTAIALPTSTSADALAAYRKGVQALHDADLGTKEDLLELAVKLDPQLGAAQVRMCEFDGRDRPAHCAIARQLRGTLSARDAAILDATDPVTAVDQQTAAARNVALAALYPGDAEVALITASALARAGLRSDASTYFARAVAIDPSFALAYAARSAIAANPEEVARDQRSCLAVAPGAATCMRNLRTALAWLGECDAAASLAHQNMVLEPRGLYALSSLLDTSLDSGGNRAEIDSIIDSILSVLPGDFDRAREKLRLDAAVDIYFGDFSRSVMPMQRLDDSQTVVLLASETADRSALVKASRHMLAQETVGVVGGVEAHLLGWEVVRAADHLTKREGVAKNAAWLAKTREFADAPGSDGGGSANEAILAFRTATEGGIEEMRQALSQSATLPLFESFEARVVLGHTALRLGMTDAAVELLRPAARTCEVYSPYRDVNYLFSRVHARFDLGEALAATGDTAGACASYAQVVAQWGNATPRSVTAEKAKARQAALHCPK